MKNLLNKVWKKEEGFTLIELIIVIAILAIIAAIAIPNVLSAVDNSRKTTDISNAKMVADAVSIVRAETDAWSGATGVYTLTGADRTSTANFQDVVAAQMNSIPTWKYKGTAIAEDFVVFNVTATGEIQVFVSSAAGNIASGSALQIYPTVDVAYN